MTNRPFDRVVVRAIVRGRVQGVGYRAWTRREAERHRLTGWVRNLRDGTVEALFAGPAEAVDAMLEALRRGPDGARVEAVERYPATAGEASGAGRGGFALRA